MKTIWEAEVNDTIWKMLDDESREFICNALEEAFDLKMQELSLIEPKRPADILMPDMRRRKVRGQCPTCGKEIYPNDFTDALSKQEFRISGICQKCQSKTFIGGKKVD